MATQGGTIGQRITDLIGSQYSTDAAYYGDFINAAINEIADTVFEDLLLKYSPAPITVTSASGTSIENKKILQVTRIDANGGIERECSLLGRETFSIAGDSGSIHHATVFSPVYTIHSDNAASTVVIFPNCDSSGQEGKIFYFPYVTSTSPDSDISDLTEATLNTTVYLPNNLIHAIALKSSVNILLAYISNQIQDEEDIEMLQMIQAQVQTLEKSYLSEMSRFMDKHEEPGGE